MMQVSLLDARPPLHAWAAEEPEEQTHQDEVIDLPAPRATVDHMEQYGEDNSTQEPMRYALVTPDGDIAFATGTYQEIRTLIGNDGAGETGMEFLDGLYPVAAYFYVPFAADQRRMNKAANGMYWELSAPAPGEGGEDADPQEHDPQDRIIKLRGPVAFLDRHNWGLSAEQESALRDAHKATVMRLRARGWL